MKDCRSSFSASPPSCSTSPSAVWCWRNQIATLKALGFSTLPIVMHYLKLVMVIVTIGSIMGVGGGILFGHAMIASYHGFFRFPSLDFELTPWSILAGTPSAWPRHRSES